MDKDVFSFSPVQQCPNKKKQKIDKSFGMKSHESEKKEGKVDWKFEPVQFVHSECGDVRIRRQRSEKPRYDTRISLTADPEPSTSHVQSDFSRISLEQSHQMPMYTSEAHEVQPTSSTETKEIENDQNIENELLYERMFAVMYGAEYTERRRNQMLRQQNPRKVRVSIPIKDLIE